MGEKPQKAAKDARQTDTVTCLHCRYERPAGDERCHICGYPWPWMKGPASRPKEKGVRKVGQTAPKQR